MPDLLPAFSEDMLVVSISQKIALLEITLQTRIKLALRWIDSAEHETQGIDEFLKLWFAIEIISMPDTTDIKPLCNQLAIIYNIEKSKVQEYFSIGLIFGLRSKIVHNGLNIGIHDQLNQYLRAIFYDILLSICSLPTKKKAQQILENSNFNKSDWMPTKELLK